MSNDIFTVGQQVSVETSDGQHLGTRLLGWEQPAFLITGMLNADGKQVSLSTGERCKIRFLKDGVAYGFETTVTRAFFQPHPVIFLKYPTTIEHVQIRRFYRIKTNIFARLLDGNGACVGEGMIIDICGGGCAMKLPLHAGSSLPGEDAAYEVSFTLLDTSMKVACKIKKVRQENEFCILGVEFSTMTAAERQMLDAFLDLLTHIFTSNMDVILAKLKTPGEKLGGHLDELSLPDVLQILDQAKKEGVLQISSAHETGTISLSNGMIMDVSYGELKDEDAMLALLALKDGSFHYYAKEIPAGGFNQPVSMVLMEACRLMDEKRAFMTFLPAPREQLILLKPPSSQDPEVQAVAKALQQGPRTLEEVQQASGLSQTRAMLAAAKMIRGGSLRKHL